MRFSKKSWILLFALILVFLVVSYVMFFAVKINSKQVATAVYKYGDKDLVVSLTPDETSKIKKILSGHFLYIDNPSCGFSEEVSVRFGEDQTFCIARDNCAIVYWKEKDRYFSISKKQKEYLAEILSVYGFHFPCV